METRAFVDRMSMLWKSDAGATDALPWRPLSSTTREMLAVAAFAAALDAHGDLRVATTQTRLSVLGALQAIAGAVDPRACLPSTEGYGRRVLLERPTWSLAVITLRDGQQTDAHDHDGWGCVVTVQGIERDRRYRMVGDELVPTAERDYPPGSGYVFDPADIHQPAGADPERLTIALHFLVHDAGAGQHHHEGRVHAA